MRYGLPASPSKCDVKPWKATAVALLVGMTTYWRKKRGDRKTAVRNKTGKQKYHECSVKQTLSERFTLTQADWSD